MENDKDEKINKAKILRARKEKLTRGDILISGGKKQKTNIFYTDVNIGERLRDIRKDNNFTQAELAELVGLTRSAINSWEMSDSFPSTQYLIRLAKLYKVSTDYLLGLDNREMVDISNLSQSEKEIIYGLIQRFKK